MESHTFSMLLLALLSLVTVSLQAPQADKKPHIVFMLVDDWGWANVGYHRDTPTKDISTPNLDGLVKEGLQLDQHYVYNWCAPSRSALLSGRVPIHVYHDDCDVCYNPDDPVSGYGGIPRNMTVIAAKMKEAGYATHQVGKWHVGYATPDHIPKGRGFESSFGYLSAANDYYNETAGGNCNQTQIVDLWDFDKPANNKNGTDYEEGLFRDRLLEVINNHDPSNPLFLYYAAHIVHKPYQVPEKYLKMFDFIDNDRRQIYHAMVKYLDDVVGEIVTVLKKKKLWDNLLFITSSDNGGPVSSSAAANNYPLKGGKHSDWQGGVRVNAFATGGYLPEKMRGQTTEGYIHIADWYSTFCALAGVDPTDDRAAKAKLPPIDSLNMWPLISGQNSTSPRVDIPISNTTLISGDYKILTGKVTISGWTGPIFPNNTDPQGGVSAVELCGDSGCLFNIRDDPNEHNNLAEKMPSILKDMKNKLIDYQKTQFIPDHGKHMRIAACDTAISKYGGFWGPFLP